MSIRKSNGSDHHMEPLSYTVEVRYRTNSGCNTTLVTVEAENAWMAVDAACNKVRKRRGVIKIDGGDWRAP